MRNTTKETIEAGVELVRGGKQLAAAAREAGVPAADLRGACVLLGVKPDAQVRGPAPILAGETRLRKAKRGHLSIALGPLRDAHDLAVAYFDERIVITRNKEPA